MKKCPSSLNYYTTGCFYINNRKVQGKRLCKNNLHLMKEEKLLLAGNLIFYRNRVSLEH